ncbi:class II glutamine amidotransferase [Myxococcaceae bacterium GXIMD 01537]
MCRLFGFRSEVPAAVHPALVTEKNSLLIQSREHKDGWGIVSYGAEPLPAVARGLGAAHSDPDFERVSSRVSARTVVAHVRLASVGAVELRNAHPFLHGRWSFVHNGTIRNFARHKEAVESLIRPDLRALLHGHTDSERCFYVFLTRLAARSALDGPVAVDEVARALGETMGLMAAITDESAEVQSSMNFLVTDGEVMVATRRHRTLFFTDGRRGNTCLGSAQPARGTQLPQLVIASEALCGNVTAWHEVAHEELIGVDNRLTLHRWRAADFAARV